AQAKKGGSRRHGAEALDLVVAVALAKTRARAARCARALIRPPGTFSRKREKGRSCTGRAGGGALFAPGFFAQAKKGGSRRHGAEASDLDVGVTGAAGGSRPALRAAEDQEQLAALAPSSALRAPSPASGRRAGIDIPLLN